MSHEVKRVEKPQDASVSLLTKTLKEEGMLSPSDSLNVSSIGSSVQWFPPRRYHFLMYLAPL